MPSSIPYDPSLTLGSIVNDKALTVVQQISAAQAPVDAAKDGLDSLLSSKRSLQMTKTELQNLGVDSTSLDAELAKLNADLGVAAAEYATAKMAANSTTQKLREQILTVHSSIESPVDFLKSEVKTMPLAADSMNMDVQYFPFDASSQSAQSYATSISSYVGQSVSILGRSASSQLADAAEVQVSRQTGPHKLSGTLVLSVSCTHKNASIFAPFMLQIDKAVKVWNSLFPGKKLDPTSQSTMIKIASSESQEDKERFSIISGTTFGSTFVGMVHILDTADPSVGETMQAYSANLQAQMEAGAWLAKGQGKYAVSDSFAGDVKNLLSAQNINSHVTLLSMGVTPSMIADIAVERYKGADPAKDMQTVAAREETAHAIESFGVGQQAQVTKNREVQGLLSVVNTMDNQHDKTLDVNSMMVCLEDYLKKVSEGTSGVPVNYYLKDIDQKMLAEMWVAKYLPGQYMAIKYDDTEGAGPPGEKATL